MSEYFKSSFSVEFSGSPFMVARNALLQLGYRFCFDRRSSRIVYSPPGKNRKIPLTSAARADVRVALIHATGFDPGKYHIDDAIQSLACATEFDPVAKYLRR